MRMGLWYGVVVGFRICVASRLSFLQAMSCPDRTVNDPG